jgi:hypothetical protein
MQTQIEQQNEMKWIKTLKSWEKKIRVIAHYNDPIWNAKLYYFEGVCMFECISPQTFERILQYFCILC